MKKLYFVDAQDYNMIISDDGEMRRVISNEFANPDGEFDAMELLKAVEDDSSWETFEETVEELTEDCKIVVEIEANI